MLLAESTCWEPRWADHFDVSVENNLKERKDDMAKLTTKSGAPVDDNQNIAAAGKRGPALLQNVWLIEKLAHFDREVIPERRMHAKGGGCIWHIYGYA